VAFRISLALLVELVSLGAAVFSEYRSFWRAAKSIGWLLLSTMAGTWIARAAPDLANYTRTDMAAFSPDWNALAQGGVALLTIVGTAILVCIALALVRWTGQKYGEGLFTTVGNNVLGVAAAVGFAYLCEKVRSLFWTSDWTLVGFRSFGPISVWLLMGAILAVSLGWVLVSLGRKWMRRSHGFEEKPS
jgi:hypothetical protein